MDALPPSCAPLPVGLSVAEQVEIRLGTEFRSFPPDSSVVFSRDPERPGTSIVTVRNREIRHPHDRVVVIPIRFPERNDVVAVEIRLKATDPRTTDGPAAVMAYLSPCQGSITVHESCIALPPNGFRVLVRNTIVSNLTGDCTVSPGDTLYLHYSLAHRDVLAPFRPGIDELYRLDWPTVNALAYEGRLCRERCAFKTDLSLIDVDLFPTLIIGVPPPPPTADPPPPMPPIEYPAVDNSSRAALMRSLHAVADKTHQVSIALSPPSSDGALAPPPTEEGGGERDGGGSSTPGDGDVGLRPPPPPPLDQTGPIGTDEQTSHAERQQASSTVRDEKDAHRRAPRRER